MPVAIAKCRAEPLLQGVGRFAVGVVGDVRVQLHSDAEGGPDARTAAVIFGAPAQRVRTTVYHDCGYNRSVTTVSIRDLANNASAVVDQVATSGRPAVVTKHGKPIAAVVPIDQEALEDWVLANAPDFVANMAEADEEITLGVRGRPLAEVLTELDQ